MKSDQPSAYKKGPIFGIVHSPAMFDFNDSFDPTLFNFSGWSNHETLYSSHSNGTHDLLQEPSFASSGNMDFADSMNQLGLTTQSTVMSTRSLMPLSILNDHG